MDSNYVVLTPAQLREREEKGRLMTQNFHFDKKVIKQHEASNFDSLLNLMEKEAGNSISISSTARDGVDDDNNGMESEQHPEKIALQNISQLNDAEIAEIEKELETIRTELQQLKSDPARQQVEAELNKQKTRPQQSNFDYSKRFHIDEDPILGEEEDEENYAPVPDGASDAFRQQYEKMVDEKKRARQAEKRAKIDAVKKDQAYLEQVLGKVFTKIDGALHDPTLQGQKPFIEDSEAIIKSAARVPGAAKALGVMLESYSSIIEKDSSEATIKASTLEAYFEKENKKLELMDRYQNLADTLQKKLQEAANSHKPLLLDQNERINTGGKPISVSTAASAGASSNLKRGRDQGPSSITPPVAKRTSGVAAPSSQNNFNKAQFLAEMKKLGPVGKTMIQSISRALTKNPRYSKRGIDFDTFSKIDGGKLLLHLGKFHDDINNKYRLADINTAKTDDVFDGWGSIPLKLEDEDKEALLNGEYKLMSKYEGGVPSDIPASQYAFSNAY